MTKKQTRKTVSLRRDVFEQFRAWCESRGKRVSPTMEELIRLALQKQPVNGSDR